MVTSEGLRHGPPDVMEKTGARRQCRSPPVLFPHRDAVRDRGPAVDWLNRILAVAKGQREPNAVRPRSSLPARCVSAAGGTAAAQVERFPCPATQAAEYVVRFLKNFNRQ